MAAVLTVAANLQPAEAGMGTHQQLGLAPCFFPENLGFPCPACGMTTSWSYLMNGEFANSARVNFGGFLLALACIVTVPWFLLTAIRGKWVLARLNENWLLVCLVSWLALTLLDWVVRRLVF